jgi:hypothetical protein
MILNMPDWEKSCLEGASESISQLQSSYSSQRKSVIGMSYQLESNHSDSPMKDQNRRIKCWSIGVSLYSQQKAAVDDFQRNQPAGWQISTQRRLTGNVNIM